MTTITQPAFIAVGSQNPAKLSAVRQVVLRVWPQAIISGIAVPSGVPEMPMSDAETLHGAQNRARAARQLLDADLGIGLEGGVSDETAGLLLMAWVAVEDRHGRIGSGNTARIPLPAAIAAPIRGGAELGPLMDDLLQTEKIAQREGAMGALTAGLVPRGDALATAVVFALAPFLAPHLYQTGA